MFQGRVLRVVIQVRRGEKCTVLSGRQSSHNVNWAAEIGGCVACMDVARNMHRVFVRKLHGSWPLTRWKCKLF